MPAPLCSDVRQMQILSGIIVVSIGIFLIGLSVVIAVKPMRAQRFLKSFASSARAHYTEQALRLTGGAAIVVFAPSMSLSSLFRSFGWIIVVTTVGLLLIPWQWHHKFGEWAIPLAIRHLKLYAIGALALGTFILYAALRSIVW